MRPFYVIRLTRCVGYGDPLYWRSPSCPPTANVGEATLFRTADAAGDVKQTVETWTSGDVEIVNVNPETILKDSND